MSRAFDDDHAASHATAEREVDRWAKRNRLLQWRLAMMCDVAAGRWDEECIARYDDEPPKEPEPVTHVITKELDLQLALSTLEQLVKRVNASWPPYNTAHEGYAVLLEEVDELWEHVKTNQKRRDIDLMRTEAMQVAVVALRFAIDVCTDERGRR